MPTPMPDHPLWTPSQSFMANSNLRRYADWLQRSRGKTLADYPELWRWSAADPRAFWASVAEFFEVIWHEQPRRILSDDPMPNARWFEGGTLNYAEHIFRMARPGETALVFRDERGRHREMSWDELARRTASFAKWLKTRGVKKGDRVVAYLPNIPEATIGFLAACSIGAVWSSTSPDFGLASVVDRFAQVEPVVLLACDGYTYGGKRFDKRRVVADLVEALPTLKQVVCVPYLEESWQGELPNSGVSWEETQAEQEVSLAFKPVPFDHPIWVLYSSGTTGIPKAITHSQGGVLIEHLKYVHFHNDVKVGERFFWFTTTGWMMWNFVQASLLAGATIVLYDGSPAQPDLMAMWRFAEEVGIHHFGTSAPFLVACMKEGLEPGSLDLSRLRSIGSTGAPLPPEAFEWAYAAVKQDLWLCSMSGGTDLCTAFVGGCPWEPVYAGEIQCRCLGAALYAFDEAGEAVIGEVGEMVLTQPMPSMPIYFWNDPGKARYIDSYFDHYPGIWRHGDWVRISERGTVRILGRSDATLNRQGIRIGTAEIYRSLNKVEAVKDGLIVNLELSGGRHYMPLFVIMKEGKALDDAVRKEIAQILRSDYSPRHVPDEIIEVPDIPYTISGKKLEAPVKKILLGMPVSKAANKDAMRNPESVGFFQKFADRLTR